MKLNRAQREAVEHDLGPLLVLAGAGSGKTGVVTRRIARLIESGVPARALLAMTFTNKAAGEMQERVTRLVGARAEKGLTVCTFHRFGLDVLSREARTLGLRGGRFAIYDRGDCLGVLRDVMRRTVTGRSYDLGAVLNRISLAKNAFLDPESYAASVADTDDPYDDVTALAYPRYQDALASLQAYDFDDLVCEPVRLWRRRDEVLERWRMRYRYLIVDEYQDTNLAQLEMLRLLAAEHRNLCVVGDDDQAIYAWRGADVRNILDFEKHFAGTRVVRLEKNYRSSEMVLAAANAVLGASGARRHAKTLIPTRGAGDKIKLVVADDGSAEARFVAAEAHRLIDRGMARPRQIAVLYRSNLQAGELEAELKARALAYQVFGGTALWERKEVKDVLAYLEAAIDPTSELAVRRSLNYPPRGIGEVALKRLATHATAHDLSLSRAIERAHAVADLGAAVLEGCRSYLRILEQVRQKVEARNPAKEVVSALCEAIELKHQLQAEAGTNLKAGARRWANVEHLLRACARRDDKGAMGADEWRKFLRLLLLREDAEDTEASERLTLTTMHGAKGLEFDVVFVVGLEEGLMPHARSVDERITDPSASGDEIEQERRLFYVAITRAREQLYLCRARARLLRGKASKRTPSRFLACIPDELCETLDVSVPTAGDAKRGAADVLAALLGNG